ncbi:hypothetical protein FGL98_24520 [Leekyejoonella antrihumi]|uniref:Metallo-beta-lactamase domain-containing protein n=2 Tax=Leekyejoonella antrihumi TaxID=1660198 RepID=A0A563DR90_9MICO|nr:hypothetical protein FGL98_24520 [Leekyejoonella antrihumi]
MADDHVQVTAVLVPHGPVFPSFAFRFDTDHGSITFSGDTTRSNNLIRLARGTDILVHEAIGLEGSNLPPDDLKHMLQSHVNVTDVGTIAECANVSTLVLSHITDLGHEQIDVERWTKLAATGFHGTTIIGTDLQRLTLA